LAFWKRLNASRTSSGVQGFAALAFDVALALDAFGFGAFGALFVRAELVLALAADFFGIDRTPALLARWARMIFAMERIY
jgi:hypothetical protein